MDNDGVSDPQGEPSAGGPPEGDPPASGPYPDTGRLIADRYRLETRLGGGAMGTVWSGTDEFLRRPVAVKAVRLPLGMPEAEAAELRERTLREARAIAVVSHPNVVTLYDVARDGGEPFVVMELVPSQSLATILREHGALDEPQLATIAESVASALQAAHRSGVIHRDVKPGNVLLGEYDRVKLSDFGVSRNLAEASLTRSGIMLGTPAFIAPEVAAGELVSSAADLWGLGATLFAASEGHPPYDTDDNPLATVTSVVRGPVPSPTRTGPIGDVIAALMVKDPHRRMPLAEVRRRVHHLLPDPDVRPFEQLLGPDVPTVRVHKPAPGPPAQQAPVESEPAALAADPGPLPFTPRDPAPRRRSPWAVALLAIAAVLVFALAAGAGFAGSRTWAGRTLLPTSPPSGTRANAPLPLEPHVGQARHPGDDGEGRFIVPVPQGWTMFHGYRSGRPTHSMTVHFVSPDGRTELAVQRFGGYYTRGYTTQGYLNTLEESATGKAGDFRLNVSDPVGEPGGTGRGDRLLTYSTALRGVRPDADSVTRRGTHARLMPRDGDLWVLRVTTPAGHAREAERLFHRVLPGFKPLP